MKKLLFLFLILSLGAQAQWTDNAEVNTIINDDANAHYVPKVASTPSGEYFFSWYGGAGNLDMNLAFLAHDGTDNWESDMKVSTYAQNSWVDDYTLLSDMDGNAIVIFSDIRNGNKDVVVYKVDAEGNNLWGEDGIVFPVSGSDEYQPTGVVTNDNALVVLFSTNYTAGTDKIFVHKILEDGTLPWGEEGKSFSGFGSKWAFPSAIANEDGGFSFGFFKETGNFPALTRHIAAIRCDADGEMVWDSEKIITDAGGIAAWDDLHLFGTGDGSLYFAWDDDRYFNMTNEVYAQYVDADGVVKWETDGLLLGTEASGHQLSAVISGTNINGEFVVLWNLLNGNQSMAALKYQRVSADGELLEGDAGATIIGMNDQLQAGSQAVQIEDETYYFYRNFFEGSTYLGSLNMLALDAEGEQVWESPTEISNSQNSKSHAFLSKFHSNQAVVTWSDELGNDTRVMAQNIFTDGSIGESEFDFATVVFTITDEESSEAIEGAEVNLEGSIMLTDTQGVATFSNIVFGEDIDVTVSKEAFYSYEGTIDIAEEVVELDISLEPIIDQVSNFSAAQFSVYPNPAQEQISIRLNKAQEYRIQLLNQLGQVLSDVYSNGNTSHIDISSYKRGVYFIKIISNDTYQVKSVAFE
ncbi:T9SS type A sorting domain-containing protein [Lentimicrobium sp. S6]|uniref:T9SS type A sorting domain-containing protein n=1 Tax=Lentimicrobium sp. S6 TaxID=2735872 RepID=UPI00155585D2|nr:T9SS type A sorting domain-containing protein [Lentimicrobium sp. S6]NPD45111.1 T9SS type A sorting domain-containing protein [Lentimicrobium sp. S6]